MQLIEELSNCGLALKPMFTTLFEPAARHLGDLWGEDLCTEFDVTLGLCRLQTAASFLSPELHRPGRLTRPAVLIASEPGELHRLGATLDGSVLRKAGWSPQSGNPSSDGALQDLVSTQWFDVLDLSLSVAFRQDHLLGKVSTTIEKVRRASCNKDLAVIVGGRVFLEEDTAAAEVGADFALTTASEVERSILRTVSSTRTATTSSTVELQVLPTLL